MPDFVVQLIRRQAILARFGDKRTPNSAFADINDIPLPALPGLYFEIWFVQVSSSEIAGLAISFASRVGVALRPRPHSLRDSRRAV